MFDFTHPSFIIPATFISEDLTFLASLVLVQNKNISALSFVLLYSTGVILGDIGLYSIGYLLGREKNWWIVKKIKRYFPYSKKTGFDFSGGFDNFLLFTRCLPGSRIPTYVSCGVAGYPFFKFVILLFASAIFYCLTGVAIINVFTSIQSAEFSNFDKFIISLFAFISSGLFFKLGFKVYSTKKKYGRLFPFLWIQICRLKHLEFWPSLVLYIPFVPAFIYLLLKNFGFSPLATNPAIFMSGLAGENKSDIDKLIKNFLNENRLRTSRALPDVVVDESWLESHELRLPLVVKPDSGLRGQDVHLVQDMGQLQTLLSSGSKPWVLQEYAKEPFEWGVFFYKVPGKNRGHIFSINEKHFPMVTGNGGSTVLELILEAPKYALRFDMITAQFSQQQLGAIPSKGEEVSLVFCGNHSKGSIFFDITNKVSSSIKNNLINKLSRVEGFYFGRLDIRFNSLSELKAGKFKIIEINGTGAESTTIYDPNSSIVKVYRTLYHQWSLAFSIGRQNIEQGKKSYPLPSFLHCLWGRNCSDRYLKA